MSADTERAAVWQAIHRQDDRVTEVEGKLGEDSVPGQLDAIRSEFRAELGKVLKRVEKMEGGLSENTKLTKSIVESQAAHSELLADIARAQVFARAVSRAVVWVGGSAKRVVVTLGAIAAAALAMWALVEKFLTGKVH